MWFVIMIGILLLAIVGGFLRTLISILFSIIQLIWIYVSIIIKQVGHFILKAFIYQYHDYQYYAAIKKEKLNASQEQIN